MLVTAGPGSGKTHVLTSRILYLVQERLVPPGQILVITFTREAARSMQRRYLEISEKFLYSEEAQSGQVSFGTFHSFFYQILRSSEKYTRYRIIGEAEKQKLIYPLLKDIKVRRGENDKYFDPVSQEDVKSMLSAMSFDKNTGRMQEAMGQLQEPWRECYCKIRQGFEKEKEQRRQLDLDDLLVLTARELERDAGLLQYWRCRYPYALVDEFQDCNPVQYEILKMLYPKGGNLFAVGDDDQAIYGFRGADPGIMQKFMEEYLESAPGAGAQEEIAHVVLGRNYRCVQKVVDASAKVIACNRQRVEKQFASNRETEGNVRIVGFMGGREERGYVLSQCRGMTPLELDRWAVLFRTGSLLAAFGAELMQEGIPFVVREKLNNIYEHFVVRDVMDYFRAAYGCRERQGFLRLWNRPRLRVGREALDHPVVDFEHVKKFYSGAFCQNPNAVRDVEQFERKLEQLRRFSLELGITFIRRGFGYEEFLRRRAGDNRELLESWLEVLDWLEGDCAGYRDFREWERSQESTALRMSQESSGSVCNADRESREGDGCTGIAGNAAQKKGIHILTMHAAKGLEYDRVFLMDVNEGNIPKLKRGITVTDSLLEEERRLFYVGMTRARVSLELLYQTGTRERPRLPSTFLQPLLEQQGV